jgi:hypothetical protein
MSYRDIHGPITAAMAEAEPMSERLFKEDVCSSGGTQQPNTNASKDSRLVQLGLPLSSVPSLSRSDLASYSALKRH